MRWKEGKAKEEPEWQRWFAWYPVRVVEGDTVWLEWVGRKATRVYVFDGSFAWSYEYRNWNQFFA